MDRTGFRFRADPASGRPSVAYASGVSAFTTCTRAVAMTS